MGVCLPHDPVWLVADFACALAGAVSVGFLASWPLAEAVAIAQETELAAMFCDAAVLPRVAVMAAAQPSLRTVSVLGPVAAARAALAAAGASVRPPLFVLIPPLT